MVDILMATYNGEKYLREQIESILHQTYQEFRIIIRDDGSTDSTIDILKEYQCKLPDKITLVNDEKKCGSAVSNFFQLTKYARANHVMFCDQDDVWIENKIEIMIEKMKSIESEFGNNIPIVVFSSYCPVGENLEGYSDTPNKRINIKKFKLNKLVVQNYVPGCVCMINNQLCSMMGEYDASVLMHDWWVLLIASAMGIISYIPQNLVMYRQHGKNTVGEVNTYSIRFNLMRLKSNTGKQQMLRYRNQVELLLQRYDSLLDSERKKILKEFVGLYEKSKIARICGLIRGGYFKDNMLRILGELFYV